MGKREDPVVEVEGQFRLTDRKYVFVKAPGNKVSVILRSRVRPNDHLIYCERCHTLPAIQLDRNYALKQHTFTLCAECIRDLDNIEF